MILAPNHEADILINNLLFQVIFYFSTIYFFTFIMAFYLMLMSDKLIEYINKQYFYFYVSSDKINSSSFCQKPYIIQVKLGIKKII